MKCTCLSFTLCLFTLFSCTQHRYPTSLAAADSLCAVRPDSALALLEHMDSAMQKAGKADRMYYQLLLADAMNKAYVDIKSDSILKEVVRYYDRHGSANERMRAHYLLGCAYRDMGEAPMALKCYQDAVEQADTTSKECNYRLLCCVHSQMSDLFHRQYLPHHAIDEIWKAYHYAMHNHDTLTCLRCYEHLSNVYFQLQMPDSTLYYSLRSADLYKSIGDTVSANSALAPAIFIYLQREEYDKAEELLNAVQKKSNMFNPLNSKASTFYNYMGLLSLGRKDYQSAKEHLYKALSHSKSINELDFTYENLCSLYRNEGVVDSLAKYTMLYCEANDSSLACLSTTTVKQMQSLYDYSRSQEHAKKVEKENARIRTRLYLLGVVLLFSILTGFAAIYFIRYKKNKTINRKIKEIEQLKKSLDKFNMQDNLSKLYETDVFLHFKRLSTIGKKADASDFSKLRTAINQYLPCFLNKLTSSEYQMSLNETNLCILIKVGFLPSEIATLLNVSPQAISNLRSRLNEKIFNTSDGAKNFSKRIKDLS